MLEALIAVADGADLDRTLEDFARIPCQLLSPRGRQPFPETIFS